MTVDELTFFVREATQKGSWPALVEQLRRLDASEMFGLLFPLATSAQSTCRLAYSAALLLYQIKPACPIPCEEAVRKLLGDWDVSIEEVPWYLGDALGRQQVLDTIDQLFREPLADEELSRLRTIRYWLNIPESDRPEWFHDGPN